MKSYEFDNLIIIPEKKGACEYSKVSYPQRYGYYSEVRSSEYLFQFNLNGEIKFIKGLGKNWPDPSEWLKRTAANDWIYYSTGGYSGVYDSFGEYYLPCLSYQSNSINLLDPFKLREIKKAISAWEEIYEKLSAFVYEPIDDLRNLLDKIVKHSPKVLDKRSGTLHRIIQGYITVLPPDARHVDYDVIPVIIADGCLYKCDFCLVKSKKAFQSRTIQDIKMQINDLKAFYDHDLCNYNSIFLGQHDALNSGIDVIEFAANYTYQNLDIGHSTVKGSNLFLFGSVDSLIGSDRFLFDVIEKLPFQTFINIGLESADQKTLDTLGKKISAEAVEKAFMKMLEINKEYDRIEISANFVFGRDLPEDHIDSIIRLVENHVDHTMSKGTLYFSPLINRMDGDNRGIKREFYGIKNRIPLPSYLYLIQRM